MPYSDGLGSSLGWPATVSATSLLRMAFADLLATVQLLESSGRVPDAFLDTLRSYVIVAPDFDVAIGGASLADSICPFHVPDPFHPIPGPSQGEDSIAPFLYRLVASSGSLSLVASSASALCHGKGVVSFGVGLGSAVPPSSSSLSGLTRGASFPTPPAPSSSLPLVLRLLAFRLLLSLLLLLLWCLYLLRILVLPLLSPRSILLFLRLLLLASL